MRFTSELQGHYGKREHVLTKILLLSVRKQNYTSAPGQIEKHCDTGARVGKQV